jgi:glycosyltransferase involved in cell wall biosynthesis
MATAEAMACGAPVLVSRVGAVPEVVGDCGFYVDEISTAGILDALERAWENRSSIDRLSHAARERIEREFSISRRRNDLDGFLRRVVPEKS